MAAHENSPLAQLDEIEPEAATWLRQQLDACTDPLSLRVAFARLARKSTTPKAVELARTALVLAALERHDEPALIVQLYRAGELAEQQSVLRMLAHLPEPQRFTELAIEACRTNARSVFAAIALDNPFPAAWFPDPAFHQMVLKALFLELSAASIVQLPARVTAELQRMVVGYADERRAAGRTVPDDIGWILQLPITRGSGS